jgi:hypothetical protein
MGRGVLATTMTIALTLAVRVPVAYAQHGHSSPTHPSQPTPHTTTAPAQGHAQAAHGTTTTSHGPTTHGSGTTKTTTKTTAKVTTTATAPSGAVTLTPVQQKLAKNTKLATKLQSRLPPGTNLLTAAEGFRNFGQFVAAVNVSRNLGIPFTQLKADMVDKGMSLGQSIRDLRPKASATVEAQRAEAEARALIIQSETTTTAGTTTKRPKKRTSGGGD